MQVDEQTKRELAWSLMRACRVRRLPRQRLADRTEDFFVSGRHFDSEPIAGPAEQGLRDRADRFRIVEGVVETSDIGGRCRLVAHPLLSGAVSQRAGWLA